MVWSVVSLFSGCGGFDIGFAQHKGFKISAAYDLNAAAIKTYNANNKPVARLQDLTDVSVAVPKADLIIAGPPCQGFSTMGLLRPNDLRNGLLRRCCDVVLEKKPKLFVLENVMGLAASRNVEHLQAAIQLLSNGGYYVEVVTVHAEKLGLAQRRRRLLLFARKTGPFNVALLSKPRRSVREIIAHLKADRRFATLLPAGSKARLIAECIKPGQRLSNVRESPAAVHTWDIPEVFGPVSARERRVLRTILKLRRTERIRSFGDADPVALERIDTATQMSCELILNDLIHKDYVRRVGAKYDLAHTFNGNYRRLKWDDASPTVDTHFGEPRLFLHPKEHRGMSLLEAAALQGFPADYRWPESSRIAFQLIGNAVPPPISATVAKVAEGLLA